MHKAVQRFSTLNSADETEVCKALDAAQPLGKIGQAQEIASVVIFLLSDENSFMTGSLVSADGGYVCQ